MDIFNFLISEDGLLNADLLNEYARKLTERWREVRDSKKISPERAYDELLTEYPGKIPKGHKLGFFDKYGLPDWDLLGRAPNKHIGKPPGPEDSVAEEV
jgi:hypothetical protein